MKIWCCLCFTEEDEPGEEDRVEATMKEVSFENEGNSEGIIGNDDDNGGDVPAMGLAADGLDRDPDRDDHLRLFEGMVQAVRVGAGAHWDDAVSVSALASLKARTSRRSKGESSSASSAAASEECDHDSHHKRAKVHSDFQ